jgi:hypothetical protein
VPNKSLPPPLPCWRASNLPAEPAGEARQKVKQGG